MRNLIRLLMLSAAVYGLKALFDEASRRRRTMERDQAQNTWEGEGGAVPVGENRTAAQVQPLSSAVTH